MSTKGYAYSWVVGAIASVEASAVFLIQNLPAQAALQWIFVGSSVYGFIQWQRNRAKNEDLLITRMLKKEWIWQFILTVIAYLLIHYLLIPISNHQANPLDSLTTALSLWGTYLMARRKYECWQIWILVNALLVALTVTNGLFLFAVQYAVLLVISVKGYVTWTDLYLSQSEQQ